MKKNTLIQHTTCRYCLSKNLKKIISFGNQPPSNSFITKKQIPYEISYPLDLYLCTDCYLVQLKDVIPAKTIFDSYLYLSSHSLALKKSYHQFTQYLVKKYSLKKNDCVVDIGCNDGILLNEYPNTLQRIGVEPSNVAYLAKQSGLSVIKDFFTRKTAHEIISKYGYPKIITATNVFAHVDDIAEFIQGISELLHSKGIFIVEVPYLIDMIDNSIFDTVYHEHLCYISLTPLVPFLKKFDLEIFEIQKVPFGASGPAIRIFIAPKYSKMISNNVSEYLQNEITWGTKKINTYNNYAKKIISIKEKNISLIQNLKKKGYTIGGYGAPAKGNTLLNFFQLTQNDIPYIAETNPIKYNLVTPGSHIPIISEAEFLKKNPQIALLLSWNYLDFFLKNSQYIKNGGKFLVPVPNPQIIV